MGISPNTAGLLFLYPAYILFCGFAAYVVAGGLWRELRLITAESTI